MHNIKDIRKDIDNFKNTIKNRNVDVDFEQILNLDEENRKLIHELIFYFLHQDLIFVQSLHQRFDF